MLTSHKSDLEAQHSNVIASTTSQILDQGDRIETQISSQDQSLKNIQTGIDNLAVAQLSDTTTITSYMANQTAQVSNQTQILQNVLGGVAALSLSQKDQFVSLESQFATQLSSQLEAFRQQLMVMVGILSRLSAIVHF